MSLGLGGPRGGSIFRLRRQGRSGPLRPHDQRGPPVPCEFGLGPVQAVFGEIVVDVRRGPWLCLTALLFIQCAPVAFLLLILLELGVRVEFFPGQVLRPLQRRYGVVGPYSLKVGDAIDRTRWSPGLNSGGALGRG